MVKVSIDYQGLLRCWVRHEPSGASFRTDAPVDNNGKGEAFSPTDLCASALGSCMATIVGIQMDRLGHDMTGMRIEVTKEMSKYPPRRISRLATEIWVPVELSDAGKREFEIAVKNCSVHHSLSSEIDKPVTYHWK